jgi:hypothetical protein
MTLIGILGFSAKISQPRANVLVERQELVRRVTDVRNALEKNIQQDEPSSKVANWFNWPNWTNWSNWPNWPNWLNR